MGDKINVLLDDLQLFFLRIMDFPLTFQMLLWLILISLTYLLFLFIMGGLKFKTLTITTKIIIYCSVVFICLSSLGATIFDFKHKQLETEILNRKKNVITNSNIKNSDNYFDKYLSKLRFLKFATVKKIDYVENNSGLEILELSYDSPKINAFLATIDLTKYDVIIDSNITKKELTSVFSKKYNIDIAVNGEAGTTPGKFAPLGQWTGNYIVNGKVIMMEDTYMRPFLSFDKNSTAKYYPDKLIVKTPNSDMYNVIWGRFDLLIGGKIAIDNRDGTKDNPYPRTIVGIDQSGKRAFFLIVDGRKPLYSIGMTMKICGEVLLAVDAFDAMACDQGGSSMMYSKINGIINRPADGNERIVYSHLGFRLKK